MELRGPFDALFAIDDAMGDVVARATQPALAAIKLAWWREQLEALDAGRAPAEPRLQAAAVELIPREISGAQLAELEIGWAALLQEGEPQACIRAAEARGPLLFRLAARLIDPDTDFELSDAGGEFATVDLARRGLRDLPAQQFPRATRRYSRTIRPVTAFWALARRDQKLGGPPFEAEGTPARSWALLKHRFTGR